MSGCRRPSGYNSLYFIVFEVNPNHAIVYLFFSGGRIRKQFSKIEKSTFLESAYLVIYGELPNHDQLTSFRQRVSAAGVLPESVASVIEAFPQDAHPMAVLSAGIHVLGTCHPDKITNDRVKDLGAFDESAAIIISAIRKIAARHHRSDLGVVQPDHVPDGLSTVSSLDCQRPDEARASKTAHVRDTRQ